MKISIITISYNSARYIQQTIRSVASQTYPNKEYIIIDGGSTDGTIDIIRRFEDNIEKWVSEPDNGIADAMNKGLALATGDFVIFLHSDDYFVDENVLSIASACLSSNFEIFLFNIFLSNNKGNRFFRPRGFNWWLNLKTGVYHQSVICTRTLFKRIGNFDTAFRVAMDYDFFLRAYRVGVKTKKIDLPLSVMRLCGVSTQLEWFAVKERIKEERQAHLKNCPSAAMKILYRLYWFLYPAFKFCISKLHLYRCANNPSSKN